MTDHIKIINELVEKQFAAECLVATLEEDLKAANLVLRDLSEKQIPEAMETAEMLDFTTLSGLSVVLEEKLFVGQLTNLEGLKWMRENKHEGAIKCAVGIPYTAGSTADADEMVKKLGEQGIASKKVEHVHPSTMKALLKRLLAEGVDVPLDILGGHEVTVAKVVPKK